jgi:hypothetical protein
MLITSERKASFAKRAYMVCLFFVTFGASLTMIVDNARPLRRSEAEDSPKPPSDLRNVQMDRGDWLERANFRPALQDSRDNPFLMEHLPKEDIRPLERASIAAFYAWPLGLISLGAILGPHTWAPAWVVWMVAAGSLIIWFRASRRIDAAWRKALDCYRATKAIPSLK